MKEAIWGYLLITIGVVMIVILMLVYSYTTANENDYYLLKEATEASMLESVEPVSYWENAEVILMEEKFVENFLRRFSEITNINKSYKIEFFDINTDPPKASIRVTTSTGEFTVENDTADVPVVNQIDGILEVSKKIKKSWYKQI